VNARPVIDVACVFRMFAIFHDYSRVLVGIACSRTWGHLRFAVHAEPIEIAKCAAMDLVVGDGAAVDETPLEKDRPIGTGNVGRLFSVKRLPESVSRAGEHGFISFNLFCLAGGDLFSDPRVATPCIIGCALGTEFEDGILRPAAGDGRSPAVGSVRLCFKAKIDRGLFAGIAVIDDDAWMRIIASVD
jgi:hypothetical protein